MKTFGFGFVGALILGAGMFLSSAPSAASETDGPEFSFTRSLYSAPEGKSVRFVVKKTGKGEGIVKYESDHANVVNPAQRATPHRDYVPVNGELYFGPEDTEKNITVETQPDSDLDEDAEIFSIKLSIPKASDASHPARLGSKPEAVGLILNCPAAAC